MALTRSPSVFSVGDIVRADLWDAAAQSYRSDVVKVWGFAAGGRFVLFDYCGERQMRPVRRIRRV